MSFVSPKLSRAWYEGRKKQEPVLTGAHSQMIYFQLYMDYNKEKQNTRAIGTKPWLVIHHSHKAPTSVMTPRCFPDGYAALNSNLASSKSQDLLSACFSQQLLSSRKTCKFPFAVSIKWRGDAVSTRLLVWCCSHCDDDQHRRHP